MVALEASGLEGGGLRFFRILVNNLALKIFSLVAALAIYLYASLERSYSSVVSIPIGYRHLDSSLVVARMDTTIARVGIEAKGKDIIRLRFGKPVLLLDLSRARWGRNRYQLKIGDLKIPTGIAVKSVKPDTVDLAIDILGRKRVAVTVPVVGRLPRGLALSRIAVKETVYLSGARDEIALVAGLNTEPCGLQNLSRTTDRRLRVMLPPDKNFVSRPESVLVHIELEPEEQKTFADLKLDIVRGGIRATVKPTVVTVEVRGPASQIGRLTADQIKTVLRLKGLKPGGYRLPCEIVLPEGISLAKCDPTAFEVAVE